MVFHFKGVKRRKGFIVENTNKVLVADDAGGGDVAVAVGNDVGPFLQLVDVDALKQKKIHVFVTNVI